MDIQQQLTPKIPKKSLLSLNRNRVKRSIVSPQQPLHTNVNNLETTLAHHTGFHQSPSVCMMTTNSINNREETSPPHKKLNLNDSLDFSPHNLLLSQTLLIDSPEVDWRWSNPVQNLSRIEDVDKIIATENKTIVNSNLRVDKKNTTQRFANEMRREKQCKAVALEFHRKEKSREHYKLQRQCSKFQERLKTFQKLNLEQAADENNLLYANAEKAVENEKCVVQAAKEIVAFDDDETIQNSSNTAAFLDVTTPSANTKFPMNESIKDFFNENNSDIDDLLLAATSKVELTQKPSILLSSPKLRTQQLSTTKTTVKEHQITNKITDQKCVKDEKRSSFYLQFLEEEMPEDFFASLDDIVQQAVAAKKPCKNLQRYNSMPTETIETTSCISKVDAENTESSHSKIKRHTSSHIFTSSSDNSNRRRLHFLEK